MYIYIYYPFKINTFEARSLCNPSTKHRGHVPLTMTFVGLCDNELPTSLHDVILPREFLDLNLFSTWRICSREQTKK